MNQLVFNDSILFKRLNFTLDFQPEPAFSSFSFLLILLIKCPAAKPRDRGSAPKLIICKFENMIIKPWMMCTSTPLPVVKPYAKPATSSLSNGNVNGKTSRKSANTCEPSSKVYALSFVLNLVMPLSGEEQKPFNCMPIQKKIKKYVTLISRLFTHLSIRTAAILLGTLASSPNLHPPTFPLTLVW